MKTKLRLVNRAGERLLARPVERLLGFTAAELGLGRFSRSDAVRTMELTFPGGSGPGECARIVSASGLAASFCGAERLSRALRDEERQLAAPYSRDGHE